MGGGGGKGSGFILLFLFSSFSNAPNARNLLGAKEWGLLFAGDSAAHLFIYLRLIYLLAARSFL